MLVTSSRMTNFPNFIPASNVNCINVEWKWFIHLISSWYSPGTIWSPGPIWLPRALFHSVVVSVSWADDVVKSHKKKFIPLETVTAGVSQVNFLQGNGSALNGLECLQWYFTCFPDLFSISEEKARAQCLQSNNYPVKFINTYDLSELQFFHCIYSD